MKSKQAIRLEIGARRQELDPGWAEKASRMVQNRLMATEEWRAARAVGCYMSLPHEVATGLLLADCSRREVRVSVPAWNDSSARYEFAWLDPDTGLVQGRLDIAEPATRSWVELDELDVVIVPGVAFDRDLWRCGHGGGHYDRMLGRYDKTGPTKIGLAFDFQVYDAVEHEGQDVRMDILCTEPHEYRRTDTSSE